MNGIVIVALLTVGGLIVMLLNSGAGLTGALFEQPYSCIEDEFFPTCLGVWGVNLSGIIGNPFDQSLNTTDDVTFSNVDVTNNLVVDGNITTSLNSSWGIYMNESCIIMGDISNVSDCDCDC